MQTQVLPPRPDVLEAPKRRRIWPWVLAVVVALGIGGAVSQTDQAPTRVSPTTAAPERTFEQAAAESVPLSNEAADELSAAAASSTAAEMLPHIQKAGDLTEQAAVLFDGIDDVLAGYLHSASDHYYASASALESGDFTTAADEMDAATRDLDAATALISGR